jgi:allantoate deiminase
MAQAGMAVSTDAAGNLVGRRAGEDPHAGTLLLGSHLDTVRDAGAFDGPLGVLAAIAVVERLERDGVRLPFAVDVLGFSDEEGLRFGTAYLGSRAVAGTFTPDLLDLRDAEGTELARALTDFGGDPEAIASASRHGERLLGYVEVHIEQGPVLEERDVPVGVVDGIAGATRAELRLRGRAGHAGTAPMPGRRDALAAAAELVLAVEEVASGRPGLLATVGSLHVHPGAANVVPGAVRATLDVRHVDDDERLAAVEELRSRAHAIARRRGVEAAWTVLLDNPAVAVDPVLTDALERAVEACGVAPVRLVSGAGHDAVAIADLVGTALLFVRCAGGLSHHPDEWVAAEDALVAVDVLHRLVLAMAG